MPDDVVSESLEYVVAHEIGHTLGFMHNMSASAAIPVDSLRSASFTAKYGTTTSIMDYARFNYVAQPEDKGVSLTPPKLGQYDYLMVKWLYHPIDVADYMDEVPVLEKWLDQKAGDPIYRYGRQQLYARYDPSAIEEDLGDDPIKASNYGIANLKYINAHLNEWITGDEDFAYRDMAYNNIGNQFYRYVKNVMFNIGGIYLTEVKDGTPGRSVAAVPKKVQRESLVWCVRQLKDCDWLENGNLNNRMGLRVSLTPIAQYYTALDLMGSYANVPLSAHVSDDPYTMQEFCDDMYAEVWRSTISGRKLTRGDQILQQLLVQTMLKGSTKESNLVKVGGLSDAQSVLMGSLPSVDELCAYGLDPTGTVERYRHELRAIEAEAGKGYVASQLFGGTTDLGYGYGWQPKVNPRTIDNSKECLYAMTLKTQKMLRNAATSGNPADRAHYQNLLFSIDSALQDK